MFSAILAATVLMAGAAPAAADAAAPAPAAIPAAAAPADPAAKPEPAKPKERIVCHTEQALGTLVPKKTCYSTGAMAQRRQEERQNLERMQSNTPYRGN